MRFLILLRLTLRLWCQVFDNLGVRRTSIGFIFIYFTLNCNAHLKTSVDFCALNFSYHTVEPPSVTFLLVDLPISDHLSLTSRVVAYGRFHCTSIGVTPAHASTWGSFLHC